MEMIRRHLAAQPSGYAAYLSLQRALMRRHIARGGTAEDFCRRLSPHFRARYGMIADQCAGSGDPPGPKEASYEYERIAERCSELRLAA